MHPKHLPLAAFVLLHEQARNDREEFGAEYGLCQCGCGGPTRISPYTYAPEQRVKGEPIRYIHGHNAKKPVDYVVDENGCWIWQKGTRGYGYGRTSVNGRSRAAHRVYYERHIGPVPEGLQLDHLCRVPACVNPAHLEPVTARENIRRSRLAKLTPEQVREIRQSTEPGVTLARRFGISQQRVCDLRKGRGWKDIQAEAA